MSYPIETQVYLPHEVARAAGVSEAAVTAALGGSSGYIGHDEAVALGRRLRAAGRHLEVAPEARRPDLLFASSTTPLIDASRRLPFAVSGTLHAGLLSLVVLVATFGAAPAARAPAAEPRDAVHLVFLNAPGPGGGGGGGGRREPTRAPRARREGTASIASPVPVREAPAPVAPPPEPPPLVAEQFPTVAAPVIPSPADLHTTTGVLGETPAPVPSRGTGTDGGTGTGRGAGVGTGDGSGIGPGSGGGTGGGPYRPGSGITPPRLLREVKAAYTEDARRAGITGDVLLDIVVRRDGSVGDVTLRRGLGRGLDQEAIAAVRQWRFAPATRQGAPVDVQVEVAVEFALR